MGGGANRSLGFTLAEVLVTLGIIGVVSAMTLPTLVKNHQRQVYVTQLQKVYNELAQAMETAITARNAVSFKEINISNADFLRNYFKTVKMCNDSEDGLKECFADEYKNLNGKSIRLRNFAHGDCAVLASGAALCIYGNGWPYINVDVNGKQGPNIYGRDLFNFIVDEHATIQSADYWLSEEELRTTCSSATEGQYGSCFGRILNDGWKMDY